MIKIYDGNWYVRRAAESDRSGHTLRTLIAEVNAPGATNVYVFDGQGALSRRRKIYPDYKSKRIPAADDIYRSMDLFKVLLKMTPAVQIEVPGFEADDVIFTVVEKFRGKDIYLRSNDSDLWALGIPMDLKEFKVPPRWTRLYKATVGDPSDCVPGIKGFGQKAWESLSDADKLALERFLDGIADDLPDLKPAHLDWLHANPDLARTYMRVVSPILVSDDVLDEHLIVGRPNPAGVEQILREYLS